MQIYLCYKTEELLELLGNEFKIQKVKTHYNYDYGRDETQPVYKYYVTKLNKIEEIEINMGMWTEMKVFINNNDESKCIKLYSSNINRNDSSLIRENENNFISPILEYQGEYIVADKNLNKWLCYNGIDLYQLKNIQHEFKCYATYVYPDIYKPFYKDGKTIGVSREMVQLSELDIEAALSDIKNEDIRLSIEAVLKSFKKVYK